VSRWDRLNGGHVSWLAQRVGVSHTSLLYWMEHGRVRARKERGGWQRWMAWADADELERLQAYRDRDIAAEHRQRWTAAYNGCVEGNRPPEGHDPMSEANRPRGVMAGSSNARLGGSRATAG
jgi:hypothetical protein